MAISASLVGSDNPQRVQIVVSATPSGQSWILYGSSDGMEWVVPGGEGVGDGNQLTLIDNRGPLNTPITYRFVADTTQTASPVTRAQATGDAVLQSLDGQKSVIVNLQDGSQQFEMEPDLQLFRVPGRRRRVARYSVTSDTAGELIFRTPLTLTPLVDALFASGEPVLCLMTGPTLDMPRVMILGVTSIRSTAKLVAGFREWATGYVTLDDPYLDQRLGAFSWDYFDGVFATGAWSSGFDTTMTGRNWNSFDSLDLSTI